MPSRNIYVYLNLSDIPPCQDMVQGHFKVGDERKLRLMRGRCKIS